MRTEGKEYIRNRSKTSYSIFFQHMRSTFTKKLKLKTCQRGTFQTKKVEGKCCMIMHKNVLQHQ